MVVDDVCDVVVTILLVTAIPNYQEISEELVVVSCCQFGSRLTTTKTSCVASDGSTDDGWNFVVQF